MKLTMIKRARASAANDAVERDSMNSQNSNPLSSTYMIIGAIVGGAVFLALVAIIAVLVQRRRSGYKYRRRLPFKRFTLPKETKPVISFKTTAGPGGLKKVPSPLQSPEDPERGVWGTPRHNSYQSTGSSSSRKSSGTTVTNGDSRKSSYISSDSRKPSFLESRKFSAASLGRKISEAVTVRKSSEASLSSATTPAQLDLDSYPLESSPSVVDTTLLTNFVETEAKKPQLKIGLLYNLERTALCVTIVGATDLLRRSNKHKSSSGAEILLDPYVKLQLLPEKQNKVKTKVVKNTLNPVYDEVFTFYGLNYNQLQSTTLHFAIVSCDRFSRDEIIGEVMCALNSVDLSQSNKQVTLNLDVLSPSLKFQNSTNRGDILVSMCYHPSTNKVTVVVLKAKNLPKFDITGLADPYVKVYMMNKGEKLAKKKTHVKKRTLTPVWNESFVFDLPAPSPPSNDGAAAAEGVAEADGLEDLNFEFLVMDWDRVTRNEVMARMDVGNKAKCSTGRAHWEEVRKNPRKQIAQWHRLKA